MNKGKQFQISPLVLGVVFMLTTTATAANTVVVIPLGGTIGNAAAEDVVSGKTFSSKAAGKGITGTLELPPTAQTYTNSVNMTFNHIPTGTFAMGSLNSEPGGPHANEQPQHQVTLTQSFYMQTTEVTNRQWDIVITANTRGINPSYFACGDDCPVEQISWYDAASFANWLSSDEGLTACYNFQGTCSGTLGDTFTCTSVSMVEGCTGYRLPTEAQWEYAARATTTTAWPYADYYDNSPFPGQTIDGGFNSNLYAIGWYVFNNTSPYDIGGTKPVAKKQSNKWGLYDMQGHVWEWCQDLYDSDYYGTPANSIDPSGPDSVSPYLRVTRGGSFLDTAVVARSARRGAMAPGSRVNTQGFRLVLPPDQ